MNHQIPSTQRNHSTISFGQLGSGFRLNRNVLALVVLGVLCADQAPAAQHDNGHVSCPLVVRDEHGTVVHGLKPNDFASPIPIVSVTRDSRPHRIVIVLDASSSMGSDDWGLVTAIVEQVARQGGEKAQLALLVFDSEVKEVIHFTQGNPAVLARIHRIATDPDYKKNLVRRTALYDALEKGILLFPPPSQADALFVITDAQDNASRTTTKKLTLSLLAAGVRLFAAVVAHSVDYRNRTKDELESASEDLQGPVEKSGGSIFGPIEWLPGRRLVQLAMLSEPISVAEALARFSAGILDNDMILVRPPLGPLRDSEWTLHLSKPSREKLPRARIEYPVIMSWCEGKAGPS